MFALEEEQAMVMAVSADCYEARTSVSRRSRLLLTSAAPLLMTWLIHQVDTPDNLFSVPSRLLVPLFWLFLNIKTGGIFFGLEMSFLGGWFFSQLLEIVFHFTLCSAIYYPLFSLDQTNRRLLSTAAINAMSCNPPVWIPSPSGLPFVFKFLASANSIT